MASIALLPGESLRAFWSTSAPERRPAKFFGFVQAAEHAQQRHSLCVALGPQASKPINLGACQFWAMKPFPQSHAVYLTEHVHISEPKRPNQRYKTLIEVTDRLTQTLSRRAIHLPRNAGQMYSAPKVAP